MLPVYSKTMQKGLRISNTLFPRPLTDTNSLFDITSSYYSSDLKESSFFILFFPTIFPNKIVPRPF